MHELPLLVNIAVALRMALVGGLLARRFGLPTTVGDLLAGVAIGPATLLDEAFGKTRREVEKLVVARLPEQPPVAALPRT